MKSMIVFAVLFSVAYAGVIHAPAAIVASAPVFTKTIHHQPALAPVQTVERTVQAVAHPSVTTLHQAPTTVLAKAPKISGYSYTSDVRHDATVAAAPVAVAAPVVHAAAPVVHAAPVAHAVAAPVVHAAAPVVHAAPVAHAVPAPIFSAPTVHAAPQLVAETPVVNSYSIETGRTHVANQQHFGVAHVPGVVNVPFAKAVPVAAPVVAAPIAAPAYW